MPSPAPASLCIPLLARLFSPGKNVALSPHSISMAMAMVASASAAGSPLEAELLGLFGAGSVVEVQAAMQKVQALLGGGALSQGNGMWVRGAVREDFAQEFVKTFEGAQVAALTTRAPINEFVGKATKGKITEILEDEPDAGTKAILVNAVHYKASWSQPFDPARNTTGPFGDVQQEVIYMNQKTSAGVAQLEEADVGCQAGLLVLDQGQRYKTAFIVPRTGDLATLVDSVASGRVAFRALLRSAQQKPGVEVAIPKFSVDTGCMDVTAALSGFVPSLTVTPLARLADDAAAVSAVFHRCTVDVHEEGAEAAAATAVKVLLMAAPVKRIIFRCDRPFLFAIYDSQEQLPLFVAAINRV